MASARTACRPYWLCSWQAGSLCSLSTLIAPRLPLMMPLPSCGEAASERADRIGSDVAHHRPRGADGHQGDRTVQQLTAASRWRRAEVTSSSLGAIGRDAVARRSSHVRAAWPQKRTASRVYSVSGAVCGGVGSRGPGVTCVAVCVTVCVRVIGLLRAAARRVVSSRSPSRRSRSSCRVRSTCRT